jgi:hypothetical protein
MQWAAGGRHARADLDNEEERRQRRQRESRRRPGGGLSSPCGHICLLTPS